MEITYTHKVYQLLYDLKQGEELIISDKVDPKNRATFIQIVKTYINLEYDLLYDFVIEFSNDFNKIRKGFKPKN